MRTKETTPSIHAGSMADIAFLLLIFFFISLFVAWRMGLKHLGNSSPIVLPIILLLKFGYAFFFLCI